MGPLNNLSADAWQAIAGVAGAITGILALFVSALAFWFAVAGARAAAMVVTWDTSGRITLENRGPAGARDVVFEVTGKGRREQARDLPEHLRFDVRQTVKALPVGYTVEDRLSRRLMEKPSNYVATIKWNDSRLRRQHLEVELSQQPSGRDEQPLTDEQLRYLTNGLSAGMAQALLEHLENRRRRDAGGW